MSQLQYVLLVFAAWKTLVPHTKSEKRETYTYITPAVGGTDLKCKSPSSSLSSSSLPKSIMSWLPSSQVWLHPGNMKYSFEVSSYQLIW